MKGVGVLRGWWSVGVLAETPLSKSFGRNFHFLDVNELQSRTTAMEGFSQGRLWPSFASLCILLLNVIPAQALYFYIDPSQALPKCFYEELPKDTLVVGQAKEFHGHYTALQAPQSSPNTYATNPDLQISVTVDEVFDNDHRVVNSKGSHTGKFTFSAADSGDHRICFHVNGAHSGGWLSGGTQNGAVKLTLDLAVGETNAIKSGDESKIGELAQKVRDLNGRLADIRREQVFQRVKLTSCSYINFISIGLLTWTCYDRNEKLNFGTCPKAQTLGWCDGPYCSWLCLE
ncbi:uncharacterized protein KY384_007000 [Bacidia gigantensis]|uniref:uncharacterized protein n=1 Tax=Bacidia gigantensis TaxID=2732470 RepID=UPI001D04A92B|nr:uncharacterized protein KY384_007000 [Bacidia gigantensis]KAG8528084.1 hypothetical protein KY384_007000 [Bacidia gigantensis]